MPRVEKKDDAPIAADVKTDKVKSIKLRPLRWIVIDNKGVIIKFEPEKDKETGKYVRNAEGGLVGKVIEIKEDMWKDPLCLKEFVDSVLKNKYAVVEPEY